MASDDPVPILDVRVARGEDRRAVVTLDGELDVATAPSMSAAIDELLGAGVDHIEIDFSSVAFMDSSGLGAVIRAHKSISQRGGALRLGARSPTVDRLFTVSGVERALAAQP